MLKGFLQFVFYIYLLKKKLSRSMCKKLPTSLKSKNKTSFMSSLPKYFCLECKTRKTCYAQ